MRTPVTRKRRTRGHIIADLSINHVERQVLLCGHTTERVFHDYGYDLFMFTFDANGETEAGEVRIQVKASDELIRSGRRRGIPFRLDRSDLIHWMNERLSVILVLYDAQSEIAYWLDVKEYFQQQVDFNLFSAGQTITIYVPHSNVFDSGAVKRLAHKKNQERGNNENVQGTI